jgi:hypothetical protein
MPEEKRGMQESVRGTSTTTGKELKQETKKNKKKIKNHKTHKKHPISEIYPARYDPNTLE